MFDTEKQKENELTFSREKVYANGREVPMGEGAKDNDRVLVMDRPKPSSGELPVANGPTEQNYIVFGEENEEKLADEKYTESNTLEQEALEKEQKLQDAAEKEWKAKQKVDEKKKEEEYNERTKQMVAWASVNGIGPEMVASHPDLFRSLIEGGAHEKIGKTLRAWRRGLSGTDYKNSVVYLITEAQKGVDFKEWVKLHPHEWKQKFPHTDLRDALRHSALLSVVLTELWGLLKEDLVGATNEEKSEREKQTEATRAELASVAFQLTNEYRNTTRDRVTADEQQGQNAMIAQGLGPDTETWKTAIAAAQIDEVMFNAHLSDEDRAEKAAEVITRSFPEFVMPVDEEKRKEFIKGIKAIHEYGRGMKGKKAGTLASVGNYRIAQLDTKINMLYDLMRDNGIKIIADTEDKNYKRNREEVKKVRNELLKPGVLGESPDDDLDFDPRAGLTQEQRDRYQRVVIDLQSRGVTPAQLEYPEIIGEIANLARGGQQVSEADIDHLRDEVRFVDELENTRRMKGYTDEDMEDPRKYAEILQSLQDRMVLQPEQGRRIDQLLKELRDIGAAMDARNVPEVVTPERQIRAREKWDRFMDDALQTGLYDEEQLRAFAEENALRGKGPEETFAGQRVQQTRDHEAAGRAPGRREAVRSGKRRGKGKESAEDIVEGKGHVEVPNVSKEALKRHPDQHAVAELLAKGFSAEEIGESLYDAVPKNADELAWQISVMNEEMWGEDGAFPLLRKMRRKDGSVIQQRIHTKDEHGNEVEKTVDQYEANGRHLIRWVRERMMYFHGESPDSPYNYFHYVGLPKRIKDLAISEVINNQEVFLRSSKRYDVEGHPELQNVLADDIPPALRENAKPHNFKDKFGWWSRIEAWQFGGTRDKRIEYDNQKGKDTELPKTIDKIFFDNMWTKTVLGKSGDYWISMMPEKAGYAFKTFEQAYYNIADYEELQRVLGRQDRVVFSLDEMKAARDAIAGDAAVGFKGREQEYVSDEFLAGLFNSDGTPNFNKPNKGVGGYMDFVNPFISAEKNARHTAIVRKMVKDAVVQKLHLYVVEDDEWGEEKKDAEGKLVYKRKNGELVVDAQTRDYAETFALERMRPTGAAARADTGAAGYDAWLKTQDLDDYRIKQMRDVSGGAHGNPYTVRMLKRVGVGLYEGIRTETIKPGGKDQYGNEHYWSPLEVFENMDKVWADVKWEDPESIKAAQDEYERWASMLIYPDNTMRQFSANHMSRSFQLYHQILGGKELRLEKFTKVDPLKGVTFDRDQFSEVVNEQFIKLMRYAYSTWGQLDYSKTVRTKVTNKETKAKGKEYEFVDMSLAESMFGIELLDIEAFWKKDEHGNKIPHVIDPIEINNNKTQLWKQVAKGRIAAEIFSHVDLNSPDPRYDFIYYENIIKALEQIPGGLEGTEYDLQSCRPILDADKRFFKKSDIDWIRKKAGITRGRLIRNALLKAVFLESWGGMWNILKTYAKYIGDLK